jgi:hypothetical protein
MFTVTAWSNGGTDRGLRVSPEDRDRFFQRNWQRVTIALPDGRVITANVTASFWTTCPEIRNAAILRLARSWPKGRPHNS